MAVPPGSIQVGKHYLTTSSYVARVLNTFTNGQVFYTCRRSTATKACPWVGAEDDLRSVALLVEREVPPDGTLDEATTASAD